MPDFQHRVILHIDMNAYFASVEQRGNPFLRGKPILVVGDSRRRSVVLTASYETRKFGVRTGMNSYQAKKLCPQAIIVDGNSEKYLYYTSRILEVLQCFSDQVEMTSCDEAFLDVTASLKCFGTDAKGMAQKVKDKIMQVTELPCSVGVAPNKLLAKLASDRKKPDGLTMIAPEDVQTFLAETKIEELCGIGRHLGTKLNQLGIYTCKQLGEAYPGFLRHHFGFWGYWLKQMGQGIDHSAVRKLGDMETVKSVGHSTTFPKDTKDSGILQSFLLLLSEKAAVRLRKGGYQGSTISLMVRYKDFTTFSRQYHRKDWTNDGYEIYSTALNVLKQIQPLFQPVRLLGVTVSSLVRDPHQEYLFEFLTQRKKVNQAMDEINKKFGSLTLRPARIMLAQRFGILSPPIPPSQHMVS